jgi:Zn finger protein HypA/HybF involved in hydrogenase expression
MSERPTDRPVVCSACGMDLSTHELGAACPSCGGTARTYKTEPRVEIANTEAETGPD